MIQKRHEVAEDGYTRDRAIMTAARAVYGNELDLSDNGDGSRQLRIDLTADVIDALVQAGYTILAPELERRS